MIEMRAFHEASAYSVFAKLDPYDLLEAQAIRGEGASYLSLFAEWFNAYRGAHFLSLVLHRTRGHREPFAVVALAHTGIAGQAEAAMLAKSHEDYRRELAVAGLKIRRDMPGFCADHGVFRIQARCWADHPTASKFLAGCGFQPEAELEGFGPGGEESFLQFAYVATN